MSIFFLYEKEKGRGGKVITFIRAYKHVWLYILWMYWNGFMKAMKICRKQWKIKCSCFVDLSYVETKLDQNFIEAAVVVALEQFFINKMCNLYDSKNKNQINIYFYEFTSLDF